MASRIPFKSASCLLALICAPAFSQEEAVKLYCARDVSGFRDAEISLSARGPHFMRVTFAIERPSNGKADYALRDCMQTAIKLDDKRDIRATAWYREGTSGDARMLEVLLPYGPDMQLAYRAAAKKVLLQKVTGQE